eukprot:gb/GECH01005842.1/.p1 GENE.gb/GECH01005842.1/~~gb/GECH01005842.1/.p1  ORF type:complete len:108 (+),score=22.65 gb/GECH01005842.1/:1-324(+)
MPNYNLTQEEKNILRDSGISAMVRGVVSGSATAVLFRYFILPRPAFSSWKKSGRFALSAGGVVMAGYFGALSVLPSCLERVAQLDTPLGESVRNSTVLEETGYEKKK